MSQSKNLRKTSEVWRFDTLSPGGRTLFIGVEYGDLPNDIKFTVYLDDPHDGPALGETHARTIVAALDEVYTRLGIPKGETKC